MQDISAQRKRFCCQKRAISLQCKAKYIAFQKQREVAALEFTLNLRHYTYSMMWLRMFEKIDKRGSGDIN